MRGKAKTLEEFKKFLQIELMLLNERNNEFTDLIDKLHKNKKALMLISAGIYEILFDMVYDEFELEEEDQNCTLAEIMKIPGNKTKKN